MPSVGGCPNTKRLTLTLPILGIVDPLASMAYYFGMTSQRTVPAFLDAKRLECAELAPAFGRGTVAESASKLDALQTLRDLGMPSFLYVSVLMAAHTQAPPYSTERMFSGPEPASALARGFNAGGSRRGI